MHQQPGGLSNFASGGAPLEQARAAILLVHGRGATAESILALGEEILAASGQEASIALLAPQAPGNTWYPYPFMSPIQQNEPHLSQALGRLDEALAFLAGRQLAAEQVMLVGFSQGACLVSEYAARNARRYGGLAGLSGGLIGPPGTPRNYPGSLDGTPVFLGCSDIDPHIPLERVNETAQVLERLGGQVTKRIYPGMGHTVNEDELDFLVRMVAQLK